MRYKSAFTIMLQLFLYLYMTVTLMATTPQNNQARWEIGIGGSLNIPAMNSIYHHNFTPPFQYNTDLVLENTAEQLLSIKGKSSFSPFMTLNYMASPTLGVQLIGQYHKTLFKGTDNTFQYSLSYIGYPYPDYTPTTYIHEETHQFPENTAGSLEQFTLSLNLLTRLHLSASSFLDLSGGITTYFIKGKLDQIRFVIHDLAHYIFVTIPYDIRLSIENKTALGANIGTTLNFSLSKSLAVFLSLRYYYSSKVSAEISAKELIQTWIQKPLDEITPYLNLQPLKISPSIFTLGFGLKFFF